MTTYLLNVWLLYDKMKHDETILDLSNQNQYKRGFNIFRKLYHANDS